MVCVAKTHARPSARFACQILQTQDLCRSSGYDMREVQRGTTCSTFALLVQRFLGVLSRFFCDTEARQEVGAYFPRSASLPRPGVLAQPMVISTGKSGPSDRVSDSVSARVTWGKFFCSLFLSLWCILVVYDRTLLLIGTYASQVFCFVHNLGTAVLSFLWLETFGRTLCYL